jgi:hypothetical protein
VSEVSHGHLKFKFQRLLKKFFYWQRAAQLYGPPYIDIASRLEKINWVLIIYKPLQFIKKNYVLAGVLFLPVFLNLQFCKFLLNKTENHFSPYPRLRKKLAINCGRTLNTLHLLNSEATNYGAICLHKNN